MVKRTKNQIRREKAKRRKAEGPSSIPGEGRVEEVEKIENGRDIEIENGRDIEIEKTNTVLQEQILDNSGSSTVETVPDSSATEKAPDSLYSQYEEIFSRFQPVSEAQEIVAREASSSSEESSDEEDEAVEAESRPQVPLSLLKVHSSHPHLVEWCDVNAKDPYFLVALKTQLNAVPVPDHWQAKRDYLSARKGSEKGPYRLPSYIRATGIEEMRSVGPDERTLKQTMRERVQVKLGRLDIDYAKLYSAFFEHQTAPRLFRYGEVYFEGKDTDESDASHVRPGRLSPQLRAALDMPAGDNSVAPPWIYLMQQLGKPPAYKSLIVPGLDADYANTGYREKSRRARGSSKRWGALSETVDSESEYESDSEEEREISENVTEESEKVPIRGFGKHGSIQEGEEGKKEEEKEEEKEKEKKGEEKREKGKEKEKKQEEEDKKDTASEDFKF